MASRYDNRSIGVNDTELYSKLLEERGMKTVKQYFSPELRFPTLSEIQNLDLTSHIWVVGDRYYKLAAKYYSDPKLWWVIAWFNTRPTEAHVKVGDIIQIPTPLDKVLRYLGV